MAWPKIFTALAVVMALFSTPAEAAEVRRPRVQIEQGVLAGFSRTDRDKLSSYQSVTHAEKFTRDGREYLSGISYQLVDMKADELFGLLQKVDHTLPRALPATHKARYIGSEDGLPLVQMIHGNSFLNGTYTVLWQPQAERREVSFWLSPGHPHDLDDIWGFFRITPVDQGRRSLVTVAVAVDLGSKQMYAGKVQQLILKSARYIRKFVDRRAGKPVD